MQTEQLNFFDSLFMENVESNTTSTLLEKQSNSLFLKDSSAENSEDIRHKAQVNRKVAYDVGQKIGGAIKDLAALRKMFEDKPSIETLSAVEEEDSVAAAEILTRDVFFNWFSMEVCHKNDVNIRAAYGMHLMIRRIPKNAKGLDRNAYINALTLISDEMQRVRTFKQFNDFYHRLSTMEMCRPSIVDRFIRRINNTEESIGFEDNPQILKGLHEQLEKNKGFLNLTDYYDSYKWDQLGKFSELIGSNKKLRTFNSSINKYPTWEKYFEVNPSKVNTVDDDTDLKEKPKRSNKPVWERVLPQQPTHNSPHKVQAFKTPEEFRHYFGFRSVEFGNYLNDEIGFKHMNNCAQAYVDLANILGVSTECMSLDYELAMAFGARGKGGALGHYERSYNVINLTRDKGSLGILAHEWFHSLDRYLKRTQSESDDGGLVTELQHLEQLPADIRSATRMLVKSLKKGRSKAFIDVSKAKTTYRIKPKFIDTYERLGGDLQAFMDYYIKEYDTYTERQKEFYRMYNELDKFLDKRKRKLSREIRTWAEALSQYHLEVTGERVTMIPYTSNRTRFYNESIKLDRWKIGKYWSSNQELAARAFEYYVQEKLKELGWRNDYLVCGLDNVIYPTGDEGERIKEAFALFLEVTLPYIRTFKEQ